MPEVTLAIGELVYIWSISVAVCSVILVGLVIIGRRFIRVQHIQVLFCRWMRIILQKVYIDIATYVIWYLL